MTEAPPPFVDQEMRDYLQRVVGIRGRTEITSVTRYARWADLPLEDERLKHVAGAVVLIGMRDTMLRIPGPEAFVALPDADPTVIAAMLAERLIAARKGRTIL